MNKLRVLSSALILAAIALILQVQPAAAQIGNPIKFAPEDKGLLFETQTIGINHEDIPVELTEVVVEKDINNRRIKPSVKYVAKGEDITAIEFGVVAFNYFHEKVISFPAVEAEPVPDGEHGKWVNVRPGGTFVPFSLDYFFYIRKLRLTDGTVLYFDFMDEYAFNQMKEFYDGDIWTADHDRKLKASDLSFKIDYRGGLQFDR